MRCIVNLQVLLNNGAGGLNAAMAANKKQREVYVGNLVIGGITDLMLRELFNAALAHFVAGPPLYTSPMYSYFTGTSPCVLHGASVPHARMQPPNTCRDVKCVAMLWLCVLTIVLHHGYSLVTAA